MKGRAKVNPLLRDTNETEPGEVPDTDSELQTQPEATPDEAIPVSKPEAKPPAPTKPSRILGEITQAEDQTLKEYLESIGEQGSFQVALSREKPEVYRDPVTGEESPVRGHLHTYERAISEDEISRDWGGGTFSLKVKKRDDKGSFVFARGFHRTVQVAGDPKPKRNHVVTPQSAAAPVPAGSDSPSVLKHALEMVQTAYQRSNGMDPATQLLVEQMRAQTEQMRQQYERQAERQGEELAELRRSLATLQNQKPVEDPMKDRMLDSLMGGESARVTSLQARQESELRQLKEGHAQDLRRLEDRHDRMIADMRTQNDRQIDMMRQGYDREISATKASHEVALASERATNAVQVRTLDADIKRLERENAELRADVRELREKKDKGPLELLKDAQALKEAIGGDEAGDSSVAAKIVDVISSPAVGEVVGRMFSRGQAPAPAAPQHAPPAHAPQRPIVVKDRSGQAFVQTTTAQGVQMTPVRKKPKVITTDAGQEVEVPPMDPADVKTLIVYLEAAYNGNQDPQILAQSARAMVPEPIIAWIKANTTGDTNGVDLFMRKVANLPGTSPLATLAGKKWLRKVGKALIGDPDDTDE